MVITLSGYAMVQAGINTVGDLREFVSWLNQHCIDSSLEVEVDKSLCVVLGDSANGNIVEMIACGDHASPDLRHDVLINTHTHPSPPGHTQTDWLAGH